MPAKEATYLYIQQVKTQLPKDMVNERFSEDIQIAHGAQSGWNDASETTNSYLGCKMKESRRIIFLLGQFINSHTTMTNLDLINLS